MNNWLKSLLIGLAAAVLIFFIYPEITGQNKKPLFRVHYIAEIIPDKKINGPGELTNVLNKMPGIIQRRCEAGAYPSTIKISSHDNSLDINIRHVDDTLDVSWIITRNNKLEFREIYTLKNILPFVMTADSVARKYLPQAPLASSPGKTSANADTSSTTKTLSNTMEKNEESEEEAKSGLGSLIQFNNPYPEKSGNESSTADIGLVREKDTALLNKILQSPELLQVLPNDIKFCYGPARYPSKQTGTSLFYLYAIRTYGAEMAALQNNDIESAFTDFNQSGQPEVRFSFTASGTRKWEQMTRANIGRYIAIVLDHSVVSAPKVLSAVEKGVSTISGSFTVEETRILAAQLNSGAIPAELNIIKQEIIPESSGSMTKFSLVILAAFVIGAGLSYLIFNALRNR